MEQTLHVMGDIAIIAVVVALLFVLQEKFVRHKNSVKGFCKVITLRGMIIALIISLLYQLIDPTILGVTLANLSLASLAAYTSYHYN